ncbi:MAG: hypothetical protein LR017_01215 [Candidatus Pacebacteria bacterium]|nr:hypothetical protein [Candidatus Paceibacterota bacterium]
MSASVTLSRLNEQKYKIFLIEVPDYDSVWYVIPTQKLKERFFRPTDDSKKSVTLYFALERTPRPGSQMDFGAFKDAWHLLK